MKLTIKKHFSSMALLCAGALSLVLAGCGVDPDATVKSAPRVTVEGVAATGAPIKGVVTLRDASAKPRLLTAQTDAGGAFSFDVSELDPPFILMAQWTENETTNHLYSFAEGPGTTNINPFSNAALAIALESDPSLLAEIPDPATFHSLSGKRSRVTHKLREKLERLFALYEASQDPVDDDYEADHTGLDALFDDVRIKVSDGMVIVTNKKTRAVIFTAPINDLDSGTFYVGNMPGVPGQTDGAALYDSNCRSCHGALATSEVRGASAAKIQAEINDEEDMEELSRLTALQIQAIATALGSPSTPAPSSCTYTYSAWGSCQADNTQTRTVLTSTPAGCTGTPMLSQPCSSLPPAPSDGAALYTRDCASCHGPLATSSKRGATVSSIQSAIANVSSMNQLSNLTTADIQAIATALGTVSTPSTCTYTYNAWGTCQSNNTQTRTVASSSPAGCTGTPTLSQPCAYVTPACTYTYNAWGTCQSNNTQTRTVASSSPAGCSGTPVLSQACTYAAPACAYTYNAWGACQSNNTQTRTVASSSPAGCSGTPVLSQACTYVAPTCNYTYSAWGACQSNNTQTRTVTSTSPSGCSGTPLLSQSCTYVPPAPACGSCHAIPPSSGRHTRHVTQQGYSCSTCHGTGYSSTTTNAATHQNGTVNIVSTLNYNASTRTCGSPGCHGSRTW